MVSMNDSEKKYHGFKAFNENDATKIKFKKKKRGRSSEINTEEHEIK